MPNSVVPEYVTGFCLHCRHEGQLIVEARTGRLIKTVDGKGLFSDIEGPCHELLRCARCHNITLSKFYYSERDSDRTPLRETLYPVDQDVPMGMPGHIDAAYREALSVRSVSYQAFAVMLRRVLVAVCDDQKAAGSILAERIRALATAKRIPDSTAEEVEKVETSDEMKGLLNTLDPSEVAILARATRRILDSVYGRPRFLSGLKVEEVHPRHVQERDDLAGLDIGPDLDLGI